MPVGADQGASTFNTGEAEEAGHPPPESHIWSGNPISVYMLNGKVISRLFFSRKLL
ncbi:hypothetical protein ACQCVP_09160 [Rossellomorea vietnamensis]